MIMDLFVLQQRPSERRFSSKSYTVGLTDLNVRLSPGLTIELLLDVLSMSNNPILKGQLTLRLLGFSYRNIDQLEDTLPIAIEAT